LNFFTSIAALLCVLHSSPHVDNGAFLSIGTSNISHTMIDTDRSPYLIDVSAGFSRTDSKNIVSGFGLTYSIVTDQSIIDDTGIKNRDLFGLKVISFIEFPIGKTSFGVRSLFDFGFSEYNFVLGPTFGYSFNINHVAININYFKGCVDFIKFSRFSDSLEARIVLPLKRKK
jgi:hypothetical protein